MSTCPSCGLQNGEGVKFCAECGAKLTGRSAGAEESRRTVSVLFADVTGSTALGEQLDPESLRALMGRYFATMKGIIEHHGGTVEKFIGDAVMAVFGIPTLHEDDALRAVRAAAEIRDTLAELNQELQSSRGLAIVFRTGVNTGQVVAGDPSAGQTLVTGDTVNTAARLEQAAEPGQILLGEATYRLVHDAVVAESSEPIAAKGKSEPVPAYRLISVTPGAAGHARRLDTPMVGRNRELSLLTDAFDRCVAERAAQLVTVLGEPGIGKSRLIHEFRQQLEGRATFLQGRCLSYGEGITYWPLADALRAPAAVDEENSAKSWRNGLMALAASQPQADAIVTQVMGLIGVGGAAGGSGEAFWGVRRLFEGMARDHSLVLVIDDAHWATPTLLDLVEHLAGWTRDAPILVVCVARPELIEGRPDWGTGEVKATTVRLHSLGAEPIAQLLAHLLGSGPVRSGVAQRIAAAAEGNPLFVEELVAMLAERGELVPEPDNTPSVGESAEFEVPATIEMLMAARLDQLPVDERAVLGRGSVVGNQFGAGEVAYLSDAGGPASVRAPLMAMVRRNLLRPDPDAMLPMGADDEAFSFRHQLIRDGAYAGMSKAERARLHERYARLLEELPEERIRQLDEVVGYHLEQAHLMWTTLGDEPAAVDTALRAASHLGAAGLRAYERWDMTAATNILARAARLLPMADPQRVRLLPYLADALLGLGRLDEGGAVLSQAIDATEDGADPDARVTALLSRVGLRGLRAATVAERMPDIEEALAIAEATGDKRQLASVKYALAGLDIDAGRLGDARRELLLAIAAAHDAGDLNREGDARSMLGWVTWSSTSPASDIRRIQSENLAFAKEHDRRAMEGLALRLRAVEAARAGQIPEARTLMAECRAITEDIGAAVLLAAFSMEQGYIEFLASEPVKREQVLRKGYDQLSAMGERGILSSVAALLADALVDLGRTDEAEAICAVAVEAGADDDMLTQVGVGLVQGRLAAARGRLEEALVLVGNTLARADMGEHYELRTQSRLVFAPLLIDAGRADEARVLAEEVIAMARTREDVIFEARARDLVEQASQPWAARGGARA